ncbi:MAG: hypothetical protein CME71_04385 [Halobacteriovorax sp.]|nr:hypothetical protein [Halobacteriovorax sp.]
MKSLISLVLVLFCLNASAELIHHKMRPGRLHSSGELTIEIKEQRQNDFDAEIKYTIKPKPLVPVPSEYRSGTFVATLPIEFLSELGYQALSDSGPTINQGATLEHLGLEDIGRYTDSHHVKLVPESSKWELEAWYHPEIRSTGWSQLALEMQVPIFGRYKVYSDLID